MTEPAEIDAAQTAPDEGAEGGSNYTPPATQAELDRIISDRVGRTKAQYKDYQDLKAKAAELDQIKQANQTEVERQAQELNRWQSEAETWRKAAVSNRIQALASASFADPSDAVDALSSMSFLDAGGQIDEAAIQAELDAVLVRKPHWQRVDDAASGPRVPAPNHHQGASGAAPAADPASQLASIFRSQLSG